MNKSDRVIVGAGIGVMVLFLLTAVFYERPSPDSRRERAAYLPPENFQPDYQQGKEVFQQHCTVCHGDAMQGTDKGPSLLHAYYKPEHHADIAIYLAVYQGVKQHHWQFGDMPAFKQLTPSHAGHILEYIRTEQKRAGLI